MKNSWLFLFLVIPFCFFSCKPVQKIPGYLENVNDTNVKKEVVVPELRIQKGDLLSIQISSLSTLPEKSDILYNQVAPGVANAGVVSGYLVDEDGNIEHHRLGTFKAEGLTKRQLAAEIKKRLTEPVELLANPTVAIRFQNFSVTVLGDVKQEGVIQIPRERVTVLEAIGLAGGVADYGRKNDIKVVREVDGKRSIGVLDLSSKDIFESAYYHLMQNDMVIVGENDKKLKDAEQLVTMRKISTALTLVTVAATLANIFIR